MSSSDATAQQSTSPSSVPDGWYPNGVPKEETRFKIKGYTPVFLRRYGMLHNVDIDGPSLTGRGERVFVGDKLDERGLELELLRPGRLIPI